MHQIKKCMYFFNKYKMFEVSVETFAESYVYNITNKKKSCGIKAKGKDQMFKTFTICLIST